MKLKAVELTRQIRDNIYHQIKDLPIEEQLKFYRSQSDSLLSKIQKKSPVKVN